VTRPSFVARQLLREKVKETRTRFRGASITTTGGPCDASKSARVKADEIVIQTPAPIGNYRTCCRRGHPATGGVEQSYKEKAPHRRRGLEVLGVVQKNDNSKASTQCGRSMTVASHSARFQSRGPGRQEAATSPVSGSSTRASSSVGALWRSPGRPHPGLCLLGPRAIARGNT
jgi:hypothetical protein